MKKIIDYGLFKERRADLVGALKDQFPDMHAGAIMLFANFEGDRIVFRQESSFYYLTGMTEPAIIILLYFDGREVVYIPQFTTRRDKWVNVQLSVGNADSLDAQKFGVTEIKYLGAPMPGYSMKRIFEKENYEIFLDDMSNALRAGTQFFGLADSSGHKYYEQMMLYRDLCNALPNLAMVTQDISYLVGEMRRTKHESEIFSLHDAAQITMTAHEVVSQVIAPGKFEYEIQAAIQSVFIQLGGSGQAFPPIVATGKNSTVLHYTEQNGELKAGDLVVVDIGAEYEYYSADIARTYPVSGMFTPRQQQIYQMVLQTQLYIESCARPGIFLRNADAPELSLHHLAIKFLAQFGVADYFYHSIGHFLGLDTHDTGDLKRPLMPDDVITIEPGIYIAAEGLGVRIEDDYVIVEDGCVCLSANLPKQPEEIEALMNRPHMK